MLVYYSVVVALWVTILFCPFFDALPASLRRRTSKMGPSFGLLWMAFFQVCLYFNWFRFESKQLRVGEMVFTGESLLSDATSSIMILCMKFLISAHFHPSELTVIKVRVHSEKVSSGTYTMMVAMFEVFKEELSMQLNRAKSSNIS